MERAFQAAGVDSRCLTLDVPPESLASALEGMVAMGFRGATLACPHQEAGAKLVAQQSQVAKALGEIDFIYREDDQLVGDHSLVRAATEIIARQVDIEGKHAMICGSGQMARAITLALCLADSARITLFNKDDEFSEALCELMKQYSTTAIEIQPWLDQFPVPSDVHILVSAGDEADVALDADSLSPGMLLLDTNYQSPRTAFIRTGEENGCETIDGLDLLVQQAKVAFRSWTGKSPDTRIVREAFEEFLMI